MLRFSDEAVPEWIPIVQTLIARGVSSPAELVYTLAYRELELESGTKVHPWERLLRAFPTVAQALGRSLADVQRDVVAVAALVEPERELRQRCKTLEPLLTGLPGVRSVSRPEYGGHPLTVQFRNLAKARNIPLPKLAEPDPRWKEFLVAWAAHSRPKLWEQQCACRRTRVTLKSGEVLEPLTSDVSWQTLSEAVQRPLAVVARESDREVITSQALSEGFDERLRERMMALPFVRLVEASSPPVEPPLPIPEYEGPPLPPPWTQFSEPPTSLHWRMGPGEDCVARWWHFWRCLPPSEQRKYFVEHPPPAEWKAWMQQALDYAAKRDGR